MRKSILFASMAALIMSSCSSNEFDFGGSDAGSKLQVSASIHELQTRAHDTSWDANDAIGVSDADNNTNVKYVTTSGDGVFTSDNVIYLLGDESHSFTAYYPYNENVSAENKIITFDEPADYMYGTASATRQNPNASFTFTHKMSELSFTVTDGTTNSSSAKAWTRADGNETSGSESTTASSTITLHDVVLNGTFDTSNGAVTAGDKKGDLTISFTPGKKSSFILPPQSFEGENVKISVNHNGKTFGGTLSLDKTTEGNDIQYGLTINKENQQTALAISSKTITGWTPVEKGNQDLEEKEAENVLEIGDFLLNDGSVVDKAYDLSKLTDSKKVVGVVYYVGNPQPSVLYNGTYKETQDILKAEAPEATHGLAIAINNGNDGKVARMFANQQYNYSTWFTDNETSNSYISTTMNTTKAGTQFLGYNNTAVIEKVGDNTDETNTEGVKTGSTEFTKILTAFRTANTVSSNCSKWYLPSYAELKQIQDNYDAISKSITKANGTLQQFTDFATNATDKFYWSSDLRGVKLAWISPLSETEDGVNLYTTRISNDYKGYFRFAIAF